MVNRSTEFFDTSTLYGRFKLYSSRLSWRWVLSCFFISTFLILWLMVISRDQPAPANPANELLTAPAPGQVSAAKPTSSPSSPKASPTKKPTVKPKSKPTKAPKKPGEYFYYGDGSTPFTGLDEAFWLNKTTVLNLEIHNAIIWDGASVTESMKESLSIQTINMDLLGYYGGFTRVYLPDLEDYKFNLNTVSDADLEKYRQTEEVKSILFFDKTNNSNSNSNNPDGGPISLAPGVNISVSAGGGKILELNRAEGLLTVNTPACSEILQSVLKDSSVHVTKLTLAWCTIETPGNSSANFSSSNSGSSILPKSLTSLSLMNAFPSDQPGMDRLMGELKRGSGGSLTEFHVYAPSLGNYRSRGYYADPANPSTQYEIDLQDVPASVTTLSLSKVGLRTSSPSAPSPVIDLTLEGSNVSGILDNFDTVFSKVKTVSLFSIRSTPDNLQYKLLAKVLALPGVSSVTVTGYDRMRTGYDEDADAAQAALKQFQVEEAPEDFIVSRIPVPATTSTTTTTARPSSNSSDGDDGWSGGGAWAFTAPIGYTTPLEGVQKQWKRYAGLGFRNLDSFDYYQAFDNAGIVKSPSFHVPLLSFVFLSFFTRFLVGF